MRRFVCLAAIFGIQELASGVQLRVGVHYPEKDSALEHCGFALKVATPSLDQEYPPAARRAGPDYFEAVLDLPDDQLSARVAVEVMAELNTSMIWSSACMAACPRLAPQGMAVMQGPSVWTEPLLNGSSVNIWPSFCGNSGRWTTQNATFNATSIGRGVSIVARLPTAMTENPLPRPASMLPPIMFRFNSEWYFPVPGDEYTAWHSLMINGMMEFVVVAEIYIENITWQEWNHQPIFTTELPERDCTCPPELQFICDNWNSSGYGMYAGGDHRYGKAAAFTDELYDLALPQVLAGLPGFTGRKADLRLGAWGYCIGGLAAFNVLATRPGRFNIGYFGSPALDFNCGAAFHAAHQLAPLPGHHRPKVYIDSGAGEGDLMNRQTLLMLEKLQEQGLVEGEDIFYERMQFGTHQGRSLLKRALRGLLVLFGTGQVATAIYAPVLPPVTSQAALLGSAGNQPLAVWLSSAFVLVATLVVLGLTTRRRCRLARHVPEAREPLL